MYDNPSFQSVKKTNYYHDETQYLPTAEKTNIKDYSQEFIERTPKKIDFASPSRSNRLSDAKRSIDEVIKLVSNKKSLNDEAIMEVRHVNNEIISSLSNINHVKTSQFQNRNRTAEQYRSDDSQNFVTTSQFEWKPLGISNRNQENTIINQRQSIAMSGNGGNENLDLRTRLNEQIKKNNQLYKYINVLQTENGQLKASRLQPSTNQSGNMNHLIEENKILKSQLAIASSQVKGGYQSVPIDFYEELERLKEQNQRLRQDTIVLLKTTKN